MTETTDHPNEPTTAAPDSRGDGRWDKPHRRGRVFRLAALVVILAGIVFITAVIFWSGFILGACGGGHHGGDRAESGREIGMMHYGLPTEHSWRNGSDNPGLF
jgi:hypothetical protein